MPQPPIKFARYRDIAVDLASRIAAGDRVIVSSSGMAAAITAAALRNSSNGAVSLALPTMETFARTIVNDAAEYPRIASDAEQRFAMRSAARTVADAIVDSPALGAMLARSYRDVRDSGMTLDEFEARVAAQRRLRNRRRTEAMIRAWKEYEWLIGHTGAVDPADVLLRAASIIEQGCALEPQIIAGFYDMTGVQLRIAHALSTRQKLTEILIPAAADDPFVSRFVTALGSTYSEGEAHSLVPPPDGSRPPLTIAQYENKLTELRETCLAIASLIHEGSHPSSIAVVSRSVDPYDVEIMNRFARDLGFSTTAAHAIPLIAHRIGRAIVTLLHLRERSFPRADVIELLRDGLLLSHRVSIDALDDATRRANIACGDSSAVRSRAADYADVVAEIEPVAPATPLSGAAWAALFTRIVERFHIETEADALAVDAVADMISMLRRTETWRRRFDASSIVDLMEQITITPDGSAPPGSVWVGDVMRFRGRSFDHVFGVRMEEGAFPQRRIEDPLLPDTDRRALGMREIGDGRDEERLLFQILQDGARTSMALSVAGSNGVGKLIRPSSFLKTLAAETFPEKRAAILRNFGNEFAKAATPDRRSATASRQLQLIVRHGTRSEFDGYITLDESISERIRAAIGSLSPTQLEDFGECPQKFLLKHILGVRDLDEPERELHVNARDKGSLDHRILERFYRSLTPADIESAASSLPRLAAPVRERLDAVIDTAFEELDVQMPPFNAAMREIERRATRRHLQAFVIADIADIVSTELRPRHYEYAFGSKYARQGVVVAHPDPFVLPLRDLTMTIEGRIDRIDRSDDAVRVIDYKSGQALRHKDLEDKIDRGVRMQLALYAMAISDFFGIEPDRVTGVIKPLRGGNGSKFSFQLAGHTDRLRETIELFVSAMLRGSFPAYPSDDDNDFNSCKYCPVNHSCRTKHHEAEKYAVTRHGDPRTLLLR